MESFIWQIENKKIQRTLVILALLLLVGCVVSIFFRIPDIDEGVIAGHSYFLDKLGFVKSDLYSGYGYNWEVRQYHYHKFLVIMGKMAIDIFGFHLPAFRTICILFFFIFLGYLYKFLKENNHSQDYFWLIIILLLINNTFFEFGFIFRPEIVLMSLGFCSFFYLFSGEKEKVLWKIILAGALAGLAVFTHLNGIVYIFAGSVWLLLRRQYKFFIFFGFIGLLFSLLYFFDINDRASFSAFLDQFINDPNLTEKTDSPILKILDEHMRFFHSEKEVFFSLLVLLSLSFTGKSFQAKFPGIFLYLGLLILGLAIVSHGTTTKYMLIYLPFFILIVVHTLLNLTLLERWRKRSFLTLMCLFIGYHLFVDSKLISKSLIISKHNAHIASFLPEKNVSVMAFEGFVFDQIGNYTIRGPIGFWHYYSKTMPDYVPVLDDFMNFQHIHKNKYIIIDKKFMKQSIFLTIPYDELQPGDTFKGVVVQTVDPGFVIFVQPEI